VKIGYRYSVPLVLLLVPYCYAMFFTFPLGDDFVRALLADGLFDWRGALSDLGLHWMRWSGRYTHHFLVVFLGDAVMTRAGYGAVCLGVFSLYGIALFGIFRHVAAGARPQELAFLTLASLLALAAGHDALNVTYYLVTDALGLGIGNAMLLMFIFALCRLWHVPVLRRRDTAFALFCSVFAIGCYEHAAIAALLAAALALWMASRCQHPHRAAYRLIAGVTLFFLLVSFLAPGNFNRQRIREVSWDRIAQQLLLAGRDWLDIVLHALRTPFALLAVFLGLAVTPRVRVGVQAIAPAKLAAAGMLALVALSAGIVLVHALSDVRVTSTHKLPASIYLLAGAALSYVTVACAGRLRTLASRVPVVLLVAPVILLFAASPNTTSTIGSILTGQLDAYATTMTQRLEVLAATQQDDVQLAALQACPFPACAGEPIPASSAAWPATYIARLYGQRRVVTAAPDPSRAYASLPAGRSEPWTRIPGSDLEAAFAAINPGPNASYRDGWLFVRTARSAPVPALRVRTAQPSFLGKPHMARLAPVHAGSPAGEGGSLALYAAPLGLADPSGLAAIFVSLDGANYHRLSITRE
jgi:hypothetical protein